MAKGELPPVQERLPKVPAVAAMAWPGQTMGKHGGDITLLMATPKDTRLMVVYGYARLVAYDHKYELTPDILQAFEVDQGRIFTFHLRPGHKWSNGDPFTTEDFRYYWEDVANNKDLSPAGAPVQMLVEGEAPKIEVIDETTIRYSWSKPNPQFLPALAGPSPLYIFRPSRYLKQYHGKYVNPDDLKKKLAEYGPAQLGGAPQPHRQHVSQRQSGAADAGAVGAHHQAAVGALCVQAQSYYYRRRCAGPATPYLDSVAVQVADSKLIPAKVAAGDADLAARHLRFDNFTLLKESEARGKYKVLLWNSAWGSQVALYPNLNAADHEWRKLVRDVRIPSRAVARHRSRRDQSVGLPRTRHGRRQHRAGAKPAVRRILSVPHGPPSTSTRPIGCWTISG